MNEWGLGRKHVPVGRSGDQACEWQTMPMLKGYREDRGRSDEVDEVDEVLNGR